MGALWKMPTSYQVGNLINGTTSKWITLNGVNGYKFTSKTDSSKYIFLPAAGNWYNSSYVNSTPIGRYWYIMTNTSTTAYLIYFSSDNLDTGPSDKWYGCSVRAKEKPKLFRTQAFKDYLKCLFSFYFTTTESTCKLSTTVESTFMVSDKASFATESITPSTSI